MESDSRTRRRNPLSDCTNTSRPSSSSSTPFNPSSSSSFNKPPTKRISDTNTSYSLRNPSNPTSPPSPLLSTPAPKTSSLHASEPISIVYSRRRSSNKKRKDKGKAVAIPLSSTPIPNISSSWEKSGGVKYANVPKAKALTVPCKKKHRAMTSEQDVLKDPQLQDFIEKQKAYFKAIDEFELPEEEVESVDDLD